MQFDSSCCPLQQRCFAEVVVSTELNHNILFPYKEKDSFLEQKVQSICKDSVSFSKVSLLNVGYQVSGVSYISTCKSQTFVEDIRLVKLSNLCC